MPLMLHGIGIPDGVAIGSVRHGLSPIHTVAERKLQTSELQREVSRYRQALARARKGLRAVKRLIPRNTPADVRSFIDAHLLMMQDPALVGAVIDLIRDQAVNAEWALVQQRDALLEIFDSVDDPYLRTRRDDVAHVVERILAELAGSLPEPEIREGSIEVTETLGPAEVVKLHQRGAAGFVSESGGPLSHAAIIARSLGVPAVMGVRGARTLLRAGETIIIDARAGIVLASPDQGSIDHFHKRQRQQVKDRRALRAVKDMPTATQDGLAISLLANIDQPDDIRAARALGVAGVGLYRTEFLFMNRPDMPDENEQFAAYSKVVDGMRGQPVTIRTLDLGADKVSMSRLPAGDNPAMGIRAIRLGLREPSWLMPQLRALLRAAARGPVEIMLPMVTHPVEVRQFRALLAQAHAELKMAGVRCNADIPLGVMIEVPAAALSADQLAKTVDFLSIGTNDLIQYTLALDRGNDEVNYLYDPLHPAVLHLIANVLRAGRRAGVPVSMCGEMAGNPDYTALLVGLGLSRFSMHSAHLLEVKQVLTRTDSHEARRLAARVLRIREAYRARDMIAELNEQRR